MLILSLLLLAAAASSGGDATSGPESRGSAGSRDGGRMPLASESIPQRAAGQQPLFRTSGDSYWGVTHCALPGILEGLQLHVKGVACLHNLESVPERWRHRVEDNPGNVVELGREHAHEFYLRPLHRRQAGLLLESTYQKRGVISLRGEFELENTTLTQREFQLAIQGFAFVCNLLALAPDEVPQLGRTAMVLSPFFDLNATEVTALLAWHMAWHAKLGVDVYIVYATEGLLELVAVPLIQELVRSGLLQLILWQDLASGDSRHTGTPFARYSHQTWLYNHALLLMNASDAVVLVADLDEYLTTRTPITAHEVLSECPVEPGLPIGVLHVQRLNVYPDPGAGVKLTTHAAQTELWALPPTASAGVGNGPQRQAQGQHSAQRGGGALPPLAHHPLLRHPLLVHNCSDGAADPLSNFRMDPKDGALAKPSLSPCPPMSAHDSKCLYQPAWAAAAFIHTGWARQGAREADGAAACARWLHVKRRLPPSPPAEGQGRSVNLSVISPHWLWPTHNE